MARRHRKDRFRRSLGPLRRNGELRWPSDFEQMLVGEDVRSQASEKVVRSFDGGASERAEQPWNDIFPRYRRRTVRDDTKPGFGEEALRRSLGEEPQVP